MQWLSSPGEEFATAVAPGGPLDVLVVGSGYGGAVAALRFAQAGRQVTVLERGEEYVAGEFPNDFSQIGGHVRAELASAQGVAAMGNEGALFDLRMGLRAGALVGNGLGGTSLINAGVGLRADARVFRQDRWPAALRHADLGPWYAKAEKELELQEPGRGQAGEAGRRILASDKLAALRGFAEAARGEGVAGEVRFRTVPIAVELRDRPSTELGPRQPCNGCGDCVTGCNHNAKLSLTATYLPKAWRAGAQFYTGITVLQLDFQPRPGVDPAEDHPWVVTFIRTAERKPAAEAGARSKQARSYQATVRARTVVLAAGTFGSTEILLRSRARGLPVSATALGMQVSGNGDDISFAYDLRQRASALGSGPRPPERFVGPTIAAAVELRDGADFKQDTLVEDGAVPAMISALFGELATTLAATAQLGRWSFRDVGPDPLAVSPQAIARTLPLLGMGHDSGGGTIAFDLESDRVLWAWPEAGAEPVAQRHLRRQAAVERAGAIHLQNPAVGVLPDTVAGVLSGPKPGGATFTVHPLGGCRMGDNHHAAVVNDWGAVYRCDEPGVFPGLYVLDGSIVPTALGVNPMLTITALAERACELILRDTAGQPPALRDFEFMPHALEPWGRKVEAATGGTLTEVLRGALALEGQPGRAADAALFLNMQAEDWHRVLGNADHAVAVVPTPPDPSYAASRLELQVGGERRRYDVLPGSQALLFRATAARSRGAARFLALAATVLINRWIPDALKRRPADRLVGLRFAGFVLRSLGRKLLPARPGARQRAGFDWIGGAKLLRHAMEVREFRYLLELRGPDGRAYQLQGHKRIDGSAGWREIAAWWWRRRSGEWRPLRRRSVWEQLTQADVVLLDKGSGERLAAGRLAMDLPDIFRQLPSQLALGGDTLNALMAAASYPLFIARVLLKTRLLDFRAPDYQGGLPDTDPATLGAPGNVFELWDPAVEIPWLRTASGRIPPERPVPLEVRLSASDASTIKIGLVRYRPPSGVPLTAADAHWGRTRVKSILLINGFAQNTRAFVAPELGDQALASRLHAEGWDVWMLEYRVSPLLRASARFSSMDDIAAYDIPAAVQHLRGVVEKECGLPPGSSQVFAFSHCVGSASLAMSILGGHLADWERRPGRGNDRAVPWLAGVLFSQFQPFVVGSVTAQQRLQVGAFLHNVLQQDMLNFTAGAVQADLLHAMLDRLFASMPYAFPGEEDDLGHGGERCPGERNLLAHRSDCTTCKRMSGILSRLFNHEQLLGRTHRKLDWYFGRTNLGVFLHGARCVEYERLVSENGQNVYTTDRKIGRYLTMPVMLLHGMDNALFDRESIVRTAGQLRRVAGGPPTHPGPPLIVEHAVAGFAHFDCTIGKDAPRAIFAPVVQFFGDTFSAGSLGALPVPEQPQASIDRCMARVPRTGPILGWVRRASGAWLLRLWFEVDLTTADRALCGLTRLRYRLQGQEHTQVQSWALRWTRPLAEPGDPEPQRHAPWLRGASVVFCLADLEVPEGAEGPVAIEALSVHRFRGPAPAADRPTGSAEVHVPAHWGVPMTPDEIDDELASVPLEPAGTGHAYRRTRGFEVAPPTPADPFAKGIHPVGLAHAVAGPAIGGWGAAAPLGFVQPELGASGDSGAEAADPCRAREMRELGPLPQRLRPCETLDAAAFDAMLATAQAREAVTDAVARRVRPGTLSRLRRQLSAIDHIRVQWTPPAGEALRFLAAACRHPGLTAGERDRADRSLAQAAAGAEGARFMLMLGDQIYADARAGLFDSASEVERLVPRYRQAFGSAGFRALAARLPLAMILDDHEIVDNWSGEALRTRAGLQRRRNALRAYEAFQRAHGPAWPSNGSGDAYFEHDGAWFFLLDTRTGRRRTGRRPQVMRLQQWRSLYRALKNAQRVAPDQPKFICSGSVLAPGLQEGAGRHPSRSVDTWQLSPRERRLLLAMLVRLQVRHAVLLSSDYHCSAVAQLRLPDGVTALAVCAPPLHAPLVFANSQPQDLLRGIETVPVRRGRQVDIVLQWARGGEGWLDCRLLRDAKGWTLRTDFHLRDMLSSEPDRFETESATWRI